MSWVFGIITIAVAFLLGRSLGERRHNESERGQTVLPIAVKADGAFLHLIESADESQLVRLAAELPNNRYSKDWGEIDYRYDSNGFASLPLDWRWHALYLRWLGIDAKGALAHALEQDRLLPLADAWGELDYDEAIDVLLLSEQGDRLAGLAIAGAHAHALEKSREKARVGLDEAMKAQRPPGLGPAVVDLGMARSWEAENYLLGRLVHSDRAYVNEMAREGSHPLMSSSIHAVASVEGRDPAKHVAFLDWLWDLNQGSASVLEHLARNEGADFKGVAERLLAFSESDRRQDWLIAWVRGWAMHDDEAARVWVLANLSGWSQVCAMAEVKARLTRTASKPLWPDLDGLASEHGISKRVGTSWSEDDAPFVRAILSTIREAYPSHFSDALPAIRAVPDAFTQQLVLLRWMERWRDREPERIWECLLGWPTNQRTEILSRDLGGLLGWLSLEVLFRDCAEVVEHWSDDDQRSVYRAMLEKDAQRTLDAFPPVEELHKSVLESYMMTGRSGDLLDQYPIWVGYFEVKARRRLIRQMMWGLMERDISEAETVAREFANLAERDTAFAVIARYLAEECEGIEETAIWRWIRDISSMEDRYGLAVSLVNSDALRDHVASAEALGSMEFNPSEHATLRELIQRKAAAKGDVFLP